MQLTTRKTIRTPLIALCAAGALLGSTFAVAGPGIKDAQSQYQKDRAACLSGNTGQEKSACLKEAGAALVEARRGGLTSADSSTYVRNTMDRCVPLPAADQEDCVRRMQGEGTIVGSVEEGGIYRELRRTVPAN